VPRSIPNLPFFYLAYRAWSHWRALAGGKHIQFLIQNKLLALSPSAVLGQVYALRSPASSAVLASPSHSEATGTSETTSEAEDEAILIHKETPRQIAEALDLPEVEPELERARWQVELALNPKNAEPKPASPPADPAQGERESESEKKQQ
jgi:hypothetical protein